MHFCCTETKTSSHYQQHHKLQQLMSQLISNTNKLHPKYARAIKNVGPRGFIENDGKYLK